MSARKFSAYEYTQLNKYGFDPTALSTLIDSDIPIEYVTGKVEFRGDSFSVNKDVLIPRIETEEMIDIALAELDKKIVNRSYIRFCDVGTGSGAIGISFAKELVKKGLSFKGILSDKSKTAVKVALKNVEDILNSTVEILDRDQGALRNSIRVFQSNLFENYKSHTQMDLILSNLPYIPSKRIPDLDKSVKDFEPLSALDGGSDGLEIIRKLINQTPKYLKKNGVIILEVDDTHTNANEFLNNWSIEIKKDKLDRTRFWILKQK